jgi:hypothetical protein
MSTCFLNLDADVLVAHEDKVTVIPASKYGLTELKDIKAGYKVVS